MSWPDERLVGEMRPRITGSMAPDDLVGAVVGEQCRGVVATARRGADARGGPAPTSTGGDAEAPLEREPAPFRPRRLELRARPAGVARVGSRGRGVDRGAEALRVDALRRDAQVVAAAVEHDDVLVREEAAELVQIHPDVVLAGGGLLVGPHRVTGGVERDALGVRGDEEREEIPAARPATSRSAPS